jgi:hypothetical protein
MNIQTVSVCTSKTVLRTSQIFQIKDLVSLKIRSRFPEITPLVSKETNCMQMWSKYLFPEALGIIAFCLDETLRDRR